VTSADPQRTHVKFERNETTRGRVIDEAADFSEAFFWGGAILFGV